MDKSEIIEQLRKDERTLQFISKFSFSENSLNSFLESYAECKMEVLKNGNRIGAMRKRYQEKARKLAWKAYEAILNRKIFICQCLWRAKMLDIPGVDISFEFRDIGENSRHCNFIDPPTPEELNLMKQFLSRPDFSKYDLDDYHDWQAAESYMDAKSHSKKEYPLWYQYCDDYLNEVDWRSLPDIKGEKEEFYLNLKTGNQETKPSPPSSKTTETSKPPIYYDQEERMVEELARHLGDEQTALLMEEQILTREGQMGPDHDEALLYLQMNEQEQIPIPEHENWAEALNMAADQHQARLAVAQLDEVHEEFLYCKQNNLFKDPKEGGFSDIIPMFKEKILESRKKLGEPENFNY